MYRFDVAPGSTPGVFRIEVDCSSGTYVRVLAADLGAALGGGAHLRNLRRTRIGSFSAEDARPRRRARRPAMVLTPAEALRDLDQVVVPARRRDARSPAGCPSTGCRSGSPGRARGGWSTRHHRLLAVYEATDTDRIRPAVVVQAAG